MKCKQNSQQLWVILQATKFETARLAVALRKLKENCPPEVDPTAVAVHGFQ